MTKRTLHGLEAEREIHEEVLYRDTRPTLVKFRDWCKVPTNMAILLAMSAVAAFMFPAFNDYIFIISSIFFLLSFRVRESCPLKMPVQSGLHDPNQLNPATGAPSRAAGIFYLGNEIKTGKEVWLTNDDCRQHFLVIGTTGAGKSLPDDARVHTIDGWRAMGDLRAGDILSMPDGSHAAIDGVFPQGEIDIFTVTFADGRSAEACPDHLWEVFVPRLGGGERRRLLTTRQVAGILAQGGKASIRLAAPVEKPAVTLPLIPYCAGAMAASRGPFRLLLRPSDDPAAIDAAAAALGYGPALQETARCAGRKGGGTRGRSFAGSSLVLQRQGQVQSPIPLIYRNGTVAQRWSFMQGFASVSGRLRQEDGCLEITGNNREAALGLQEIVWSLGGIAELCEKGGSLNEGSSLKGSGLRKDHPARLGGSGRE